MPARRPPPERTLARDRELGMDRPIARRDFLNGVALGAAGLLAAPRSVLAGSARGGPAPTKPGEAGYPPALGGLRGSHDGSWEVAHALRDGTFWQDAGEPEDTGEAYDLVVVGAGLSGLSAAHFFRQHAGRDARVLVLDNHDDFGGHAKRNEWTVDGATRIGFGGTWAIDSPAPYSAVARGLVTELGIDVSSWERAVDPSVYGSRGLGSGLFFDRESFGVDRLVRDPTDDGKAFEGAVDEDAFRAFLAEAPLAPAAGADLLRLYREQVRDPWPDLDSAAKKAKLARVSYADYLTKVLGLDAGVLPMVEARVHGLFGAGMDAVPAQDAWGFGYPGFRSLRLAPGAGPGQNLDSIPPPEKQRYFFHFPDGNATLARLLVRGLVPDAVPGRSAADVVSARVDYGRLDAPASTTRLRLSSTVVRVRHVGSPDTAREVEVVYATGGRCRSVRARHVVLACWHVVIPFLCPEMPAEQRDALASATKVPLLYTNVLVRRWTSFVRLGVAQVHAPRGYHHGLGLDMPVSVGEYACTRDPEQPMVLHLAKAACQPGLPIRDQHLAGRIELFQTPFEEMERRIRDQLARTLGPGGFDPAEDVLGITVNRWPHGYAYQYNSLWDDFWLTNQETPCARARRPFGRITIANADAAAYAYTDASFDEAFRAVQEALPRRG